MHFEVGDDYLKFVNSDPVTHAWALIDINPETHNDDLYIVLDLIPAAATIHFTHEGTDVSNKATTIIFDAERFPNADPNLPYSIGNLRVDVGEAGMRVNLAEVPTHLTARIQSLGTKTMVHYDANGSLGSGFFRMPSVVVVDITALPLIVDACFDEAGGGCISGTADDRISGDNPPRTATGRPSEPPTRMSLAVTASSEFRAGITLFDAETGDETISASDLTFSTLKLDYGEKGGNDDIYVYAALDTDNQPVSGFIRDRDTFVLDLAQPECWPSPRAGCSRFKAQNFMAFFDAVPIVNLRSDTAGKEGTTSCDIGHTNIEITDVPETAEDVLEKFLCQS